MNHKDSAVKLTVQRRILITSVFLFAAKLVAYFLTNSVGILTDALESTVNVLTGFISLYSIGVALKPRDDSHPFGHGKIESISASVEGFLILLAGLIIIFEAVQRLFNPLEIQKLDIGIIIIAIAGVINYILGYYSIKTGRKHESIALVAGGKHLQSDTYSTIGLVIGLVLLLITKLAWLDSLVAILFGSIIIYTGYKILRETTSNLMDEADFKILEKVTNILWESRSKNWIEIHNLKLVKYGDASHIDCDLRLPWYLNIKEAHKESDAVVQAITKHFPENIDFTIHTDACTDRFCPSCEVEDCRHRQKKFVSSIKWTMEKTIQKKG